MRLVPPLPAVVLARAVVADAEAQVAEPVAVVLDAVGQALLARVAPVLPAVPLARLQPLPQLQFRQFPVDRQQHRAAVDAGLAVKVAEAAGAQVVVEVVAQAAVLSLPQPRVLKCRAWRSSTCCWLPESIRIRNSTGAGRKPAVVVVL